jgi:hypothetical protein
VKLDENTQIKANAAFAAKLIVGIITAVWSYSVIVNRISALELELVRLKDDIHLNREFRIQWPRGTMGSLPDDSEQNMRLDFYEREMEKMKVIVDDLRFKRLESGE